MREALNEAKRVLDELASDERRMGAVERAAGALAECVRGGGRILACGNGGSACDAMHFCEELTGRYRDDRPPIGAIACVDPGHLTCVGNDYGFDEVFARWVRGVGRAGDALVLLSTSGNSDNVLRAAQAAGDIGIVRIALLGKGGGRLRGACEHEIIVPGETSDRIQELHMFLLHGFVESIERSLQR